MLVPVVSKVFEDLAVGASLVRGEQWRAFHREPNVVGFELQHGVLTERYAYNDRCFARLHRQKAEVARQARRASTICSTAHPVEGNVQAVLVTGPIATSLPSRIRGRGALARAHRTRGTPSDPEFPDFLTVTLSTLTLEDDRLAPFRRLLGRLAVLMASEGHAERLADEISVLRHELAAVRVRAHVGCRARDDRRKDEPLLVEPLP